MTLQENHSFRDSQAVLAAVFAGIDLQKMNNKIEQGSHRMTLVFPRLREAIGLILSQAISHGSQAEARINSLIDRKHLSDEEKGELETWLQNNYSEIIELMFTLELAERPAPVSWVEPQ